MSLRYSSYRMAMHTNVCIAVLIAAALLACVSTSGVVHTAEGKNIHVTLQTAWRETSFFAEVCEMSSHVNGSEGFYRCLEVVDAHLSRTGTRTQDEQPVYDRTKTLYSQQLQWSLIMDSVLHTDAVSPNRRALAQMELASRVYSPAVEAHRQIACQTILNCPSNTNAASPSPSSTSSQEAAHHIARAFILATGTTVHSVGELKSALESYSQNKTAGTCSDAAAQQGFEEYPAVDHVHPESSRQHCDTVVLFGLVGEEVVMDMYHLALKYLPHIRLLFRHTPYPDYIHGVDEDDAEQRASWASPVYASGYGVALDLKNMEYKVIDEKKEKKDEAEQADNSVASGDESVRDAHDRDTQPIAGFNISRLIERFPDQALALEDFGQFLEEREDSADLKMDLDVWELQNLGLAAATTILESSDPLGTLATISHNFPLHVSQLSRKPPVEQYQTLHMRIRYKLYKLLAYVGPEASVMFVNGRQMEADKMDLFNLLDVLHKDENLGDAMAQSMTHKYTAPPTATASTMAEAKVMHTTAAVNPLNMRKTLSFLQRCSLRRGAPEKPASRFFIPDDAVIWMNDVRTDETYAAQPKEVDALRKTTPYGTPIMPRQNVLHSVILMDPSEPSSWSETMQLLKSAQQPTMIRIGVAVKDPTWKKNIEFNPTLDKEDDQLTDPPVNIAAILYAASREVALIDPGLVYEMWMSVTAFIVESASFPTPETLQAGIEQLMTTFKSARSLNDAFVDPEFVTSYYDLQKSLHRFCFPVLPVSFFNGVVMDRRNMQALYTQEMGMLRTMVARKVLSQKNVDRAYEVILSYSGAINAYHPAVLGDEKQYVSLTSPNVADFLYYRTYIHHPSYDGEIPQLSMILILPPAPRIASLQNLLTVLHRFSIACKAGDKGLPCMHSRFTFAHCKATALAKNAVDPEVAISLRIVDDLERILSGSSALVEKLRITGIHTYLTAILQAAGELDIQRKLQGTTATVKDITDMYEKLVKLALPQLSDPVKRMLQSPLPHSQFTDDFCSAISLTENALTSTDYSDVLLLANGRLVKMDEAFGEGEVEFLTKMEYVNMESMWSCVSKVNFPKLSSDFIPADLTKHFLGVKLTAISSALMHDQNSRGPVEEQNLVGSEGVGVGPREADPLESGTFVVGPTDSSLPVNHRVTIVVDPIARSAQALVSLCQYVTRSPLGVQCTVILNPSTAVHKVPITNFYQYVAPLQAQFHSQGHVLPPFALFRRMPTQQLLTLGLDEPESWLVFPHKAEQDLDNIILGKLPKHEQTLSAAYRIGAILVTGSAADAHSGRPPRGLPVALRNHRDPALATDSRDTLIMLTRGYFQLQSNPGLWYLGIMPGDASPVYYTSLVDDRTTVQRIAGSSPSQPSLAAEAATVVVNSFNGKFLMVEVSKRAGKENVVWENLLHQKDAERQKSQVQFPPPAASSPRKQKPTKPTLNIFSVASGHLYERFLRLMMHTVMKSSSDIHGVNTTLIKFWVIENFLSPQFKEFVPRMAKHYGFEVGFVTYRWPSWLRKQTEKQRTIWGYKILFLDVLFPLDVDRVIFVDADQIVRADLHELYNMDIKGAPVAYTPFCRKHMNQDTAGFRFWDSGFWVSHLKDKPYHISAIYLVDLFRLRAIAGGDSYRMTYQRLSGDPNSLANLDQDLPNYMQHHVPIFSLPEEWLWCETWCDQESKAAAKTIDLCNNPLTKTPKLENAKRIIPDWAEMDDKLEQLADQLNKQA